jgi:hypothetical protein
MSQLAQTIVNSAAHPHLLRIDILMPENEMVCCQVQCPHRGLATFDQGYTLDLRESQRTLRSFADPQALGMRIASMILRLSKRSRAWREAERTSSNKRARLADFDHIMRGHSGTRTCSSLLAAQPELQICGYRQIGSSADPDPSRVLPNSRPRAAANGHGTAFPSCR